MNTRDRSEDFEAPRKRRRPAKSCDQCRNRKVRCDLNHPCGPCQRARGALACSYREGIRGARRVNTVEDVSLPQRNDGEIDTPGVAGHRSPLATPHELERPQETESNGKTTIKTLQSRLRTLEEKVARGQNTPQQHTLDELLKRLERLEQKPNTTAGESQPDRTATSDIPELFVPQIPPRLRAVPEKTKFYGPSHWLHTAEQVKGLKS